MEDNQTNAVPSTHIVVRGYRVERKMLIWAGLAVALAIVMCTFNSSALVMRAGFFAKLIAVVVGSVLGLAGAMIGDAIRKYAHPDAVFTTGGIVQLIWIKVFWQIGPQVIGMVIGVAIGSALVLK
jgi:hypothetical protein